MKTALNTYTYGVFYSDDYAYFVYTVDEFGQRHLFIDENGTPVILHGDENLWEIKNSHIDPYYQCGVAQILENGDYKLLSLSNKVENPLLDPTGIEEQATGNSLYVYPNPAQGRFTVEGQGTMTISNVMGQTVLTREIDGKETIELPRGMYFVKLGNETRKIVVE